MLSSLVVFVVGALAGAGAATRESCRSLDTQLSVVINTNASGHWTTNLRLDRETQPSGRPAAMLLDVRPATSRCRGVRVDSLFVTLQGPSPPPGPGYTKWQGFGYYKMHPERITWDEAKVVCEAEDAHLVILNSEAEASAVQQLVMRTSDIRDWMHIGFNDKEQEGRYVTIFGQTLAEAGYERWDQGEPSNHGSENCGCMKVDNKGLHDESCGAAHKFGFVCEQQ